MFVHISDHSKNIKTGDMVVTTSPRYTCPPSCAFFGFCYGEGGPIKLHWDAVSMGERGLWWNAAMHRLEAIPAGDPWRWGQVGDVPGFGDEIDAEKLAEITSVNTGKRGFGYTHKPMLTTEFAAANREAVRQANAGGFTLNLSANALSEVDALADLGIGPVVAVVKRGTPVTQYTAKGRKGIVCPAQRIEGITCKDCLLCQKRDRSVAVLFWVHSNMAKRAEAVCDARN